MALDRAAVEAIGALRRRELPSVLLKGRSFADWLYHPSEIRYATDADLLVPADRFDEARTVLEDLGYAPVFAPDDEPSHAVMHGRDDGMHVDLHRSLHGLDAPPARVWAALSGHVVPLELGGRQVTALDEVGRCLTVAVHAGAADVLDTQGRRDLQRALRTANEDRWRQAAELAADLDGLTTFLDGLGRELAGAELAADLQLEALAPTIGTGKALAVLERLLAAVGAVRDAVARVVDAVRARWRS